MELANSLPLLISVPAALVALALFAVAVVGATVAGRVFTAPENSPNDRQYFD